MRINDYLCVLRTLLFFVVASMFSFFGGEISLIRTMWLGISNRVLESHVAYKDNVGDMTQYGPGDGYILIPRIK